MTTSRGSWDVVDVVEQGPEFEPWVAARQRALLRTAWLLTGDSAAAQDLVQTALLRCWPHWSRVRRMEQPEAYVRRVMTTTYVSWRRRRWNSEVPSRKLPDASADSAVVADDRPALVRALQRLPHGQRAVVVLRFAEDLSEAQTAAALGVSVGTVKSQTSRALRAPRADETLLRETDLT